MPDNSRTGAGHKAEVGGQLYTYHLDYEGKADIDSYQAQGSAIEIPPELDGHPVDSLGERSFAGLAGVRSIVCPEGVRHIGKSAFANSPDLERLVLPRACEDFVQGWIEGCSSLRDLSVPGCTGQVSLNSVQGVHVTQVALGDAVRDLAVPRVPDAYLESVAIASGNPWISSDGTCLYDASGKTLLKCPCAAIAYNVADGCEAIAPHAFAYNKMLEAVTLPEGVTSIGEGAFESSSLKRVALPSSLRSIGKSAFSNCRELAVLSLNVGLERIERYAFKGCGKLEELHVPASVSLLDAYAFEGSAAIRDDALSVDAGNDTYSIDKAGVLYERDESGLTLLLATGGVSGRYEIRPGTRKVAARAFRNNDRLVSVEMPKGLVSIGRAAFADCASLVQADLPDTLEFLGESAFLHTPLDRLAIPASVREIGPDALTMYFESQDGGGDSAVYSNGPVFRLMFDPMRSRTRGVRSVESECLHCHVEVDAENPRYCMDSGFVCERLEASGEPLRALWYAGCGEDLVVPQRVVSLAPNAVSNAGAARTLWLHEGLSTEGKHAVQVMHPLESIHILSAEGDDGCVLHPAPDMLGTWAQNHAFAFDKLELRLLAQDCDDTLSRLSRGFDKMWRVVDRLAHPRLLSGALEQLFADELQDSLDDVVRTFAQRNYLQGVHQLVDLGFIGADNLGHAIDVACAAHGVAVTGLLLDMQRDCPGGPSLDFDV